VSWEQSATGIFSASQAARFFAERMPQMEARWLPEATDPVDYKGDKPATSPWWSGL
jgi:hypothetical protein